MEAAAILMFGCVAILLNYMADVQKEKFSSFRMISSLNKDEV